MNTAATKITDVIRMEREPLIKTILYAHTVARNLKLSNNDLSILMLFAFTQDKDEVIRESLERRYVRSWQVGENACSKMVGMKLLEKINKKKRRVSADVLPETIEPVVLATIKLHNLETN